AICYCRKITYTFGMTLSLVSQPKKALVAGIFGLLSTLFVSLFLLIAPASAATFDATWLDAGTILVEGERYSGPVDGTRFERTVESSAGADCTSYIEFSSAGAMDDNPTPSAALSLALSVMGTCTTDDTPD